MLKIWTCSVLTNLHHDLHPTVRELLNDRLDPDERLDLQNTDGCAYRDYNTCVTPGGDLRELQSGSAPDQVCVQRKIKLTLHRLTIIMINDARNPNHNHMCPWSTETVIFVAIAIFFPYFFARFSNIVQTIHQWKYDLFLLISISQHWRLRLVLCCRVTYSKYM